MKGALLEVYLPAQGNRCFSEGLLTTFGGQNGKSSCMITPCCVQLLARSVLSRLVRTPQVQRAGVSRLFHVFTNIFLGLGRPAKKPLNRVEEPRRALFNPLLAGIKLDFE